jgi:hypothetical protein
LRLSDSSCAYLAECIEGIGAKEAPIGWSGQDGRKPPGIPHQATNPWKRWENGSYFLLFKIVLKEVF